VTQLGLFGDQRPLNFAEESALLATLPTGLRLGTSSWTFPGWSGLVYPPKTTEAELRRSGLRRYTEYPLFTTVGIDSSYYRPLQASQLLQYAAQLPAHFRCVSKAFSGLTTLVDPRSHLPNPHFLDADFCEREVLAPLREHFWSHAGPVVFEFAPMRHPYWLEPAEFAARLSSFLGKLSKDFSYAVELRNREFLTPAYAQVLSRHQVSHVYNYWEQMPGLLEQLEICPAELGQEGVARLLIPPGQRYAQRKQAFEPFDRLSDPQPMMRQELVELALRFNALKRVLFVLVNNKAEGSSPLTVRALAGLIAQRVAGAPPGALDDAGRTP
jgi:uncharacterized protein YecE (DUF72 family)